jgi:hypothetical protein
MASRKSTVRWSAAIALIVAVLLTIAASSVLLAAVGFGIESADLRSNPNYSRVGEQQTKTAANIAVSTFLFISLLPTFLLAKVAAFKWPASRVLRWLCSFATVMVASYLSTLIWLRGPTPDFVRTMYDAIRRVILTSLNA